MEIIRPGINIDLIGKMKIAAAASLLVVIISILSLILHGGPNLGIDFAGGTLVQIKFFSGNKCGQNKGFPKDHRSRKQCYPAFRIS